jgi:flagellin
MLAKSLARLSSGSKIVSPEDDAAGAAVALRFDAQINRVQAATNNVGNAVSFSQTQDGFLKKVGKALDRMSELAILAQDVTKSSSDIGLYQSEFDQLASYINNVSVKEFNGVSLFGGSDLNVTIDEDGGTFTMTGIDLTASVYDLSAGDLSGDAAGTLDDVKSAIDQLATDRATVGASITRLTYTSDQLGVLKDNLAAANSRIKDLDVADESTQYAKYNILVQAGTAMLAQANATPSSALRLLQ